MILIKKFVSSLSLVLFVVLLVACPSASSATAAVDPFAPFCLVFFLCLDSPRFSLFITKS